MAVRIIAGKFRSRPLIVPKGRDVRPTSDRLRETLFNVLAPRIAGCVFVDLFAGTGAVGIEALSRGASRAFFAEISKTALQSLHSNLNQFQLSAEAQVEQSGALPLLHRLANKGVTLDIVFLDPPYNQTDNYEQTLHFLANYPALAPNAVIVAEHARRVPLAAEFGHLTRYRVLEQGDASLSFFHHS